jgi:hypothetical protein
MWGNWTLPATAPGVVAVYTNRMQAIYGAGGLGVPGTDEQGRPVAGGTLPADLDNMRMAWLVNNVALHELSHALARDNHCGEWYRVINQAEGLIVRDIPLPTCVLYPAVTRYFDRDMAQLNSVDIQKKTPTGTRTVVAIQSPWHSLWEINQMRWQLGLGSFVGVGMYATH